MPYILVLCKTEAFNHAFFAYYFHQDNWDEDEDEKASEKDEDVDEENEEEEGDDEDKDEENGDSTTDSEQEFETTLKYENEDVKTSFVSQRESDPELRLWKFCYKYQQRKQKWKCQP